MKPRSLICVQVVGCALAAVSIASHAAAPLATCSVTDLAPNAQGCVGFFPGNLLNSSTADVTAQQNTLASLGYTGVRPFDALPAGNKLSGLNGLKTFDFDTLLTGIGFVGVHFGGGTGGPGHGTAFYKLDAGAGLDSFLTILNASSNAVLYLTGGNATGAVPDPEIFALMMAGLGVLGFVAQRRPSRD